MHSWAASLCFPSCRQEAIKATPLLSAAAKLASVELKKVLRRVHVPQGKKDKKDALKPFGRMLAKVAAANPLAVAETMIAQVRQHRVTRCPALNFLSVCGPKRAPCTATSAFWTAVSAKVAQVSA